MEIVSLKMGGFGFMIREEIFVLKLGYLIDNPSTSQIEEHLQLIEDFKFFC